MGSTRPVSRQIQEADDSFETLRHAFHARLGSESVYFVTLSAALARAEENPALIFQDLQFRAHRLQGGAAIFEESEVAQAAGVLEHAAAQAAQSRAANTDEGVRSALQSLVSLMNRYHAEPTVMEN